jgi:hypothetical protein
MRVVGFFGLARAPRRRALRKVIRAAVELRDAVMVFRDELVELAGSSSASASV